jgi:quercetin dioxygenase-like cupin family protein
MIREASGFCSKGEREKSDIDNGSRRQALYEVILKRFEQPDEIRNFEKGKFEVVRIGGMTIGRATYEPGWRWSVHVGRSVGAKSCAVEHVGVVISGRATAAMDDGRVIEMKAGDIFYIAPGHDSWVVGDEPYVSLHLMGAGDYAQHK